ncbi:MAG: hypothetical protein NTW86_08215 [Candidatus Sumerlaeota bacterium]|nr:hypothetical protein [Candidatus Sumerlaeota bacterium]
MRRDEAIQWIRDVRREISKELHGDPREFVQFHKTLRSRYGARSEPARAPEPTPARATLPSASAN